MDRISPDKLEAILNVYGIPSSPSSIVAYSITDGFYGYGIHVYMVSDENIRDLEMIGSQLFRSEKIEDSRSQ